MSLEQKQAWMRERHQTQGSPSEVCASLPDFTERHYTLAEIAAMWNLSPDSVRKLFLHEPGVLVIGSDGFKPGTRRYRTLRIPESVAARVHRRLRTVGGP